MAVGDVAYFEYHCYEGCDSGDAHLWYRSQQRVIVTRGLYVDDEPVVEGSAWFGTSLQERADAGMVGTYRVRFDDGYEDDVWEDELHSSPEQFCRPAPPRPPVGASLRRGDR